MSTSSLPSTNRESSLFITSDVAEGWHYKIRSEWLELRTHTLQIWTVIATEGITTFIQDWSLDRWFPRIYRYGKNITQDSFLFVCLSTEVLG